MNAAVKRRAERNTRARTENNIATIKSRYAMLSPLTKSGVTPGGGGDAARKPSCGELMPKESEMRLDECFWKERQPALWNLKPSPRRRGEQQAINQAPDARFPRFKARLLGDRSTTSQSHSPSNPTTGNKIDPSCEQKQLAMRQVLGKQGWHRRAWALADATTALQRIGHQIGTGIRHRRALSVLA